MVVTNRLQLLQCRWAYLNNRRRDPRFRRLVRRRRPLVLRGGIESLEDRTLLSNVAFAVAGPSSVTEDPADSDGNLAAYTISYTGDVATGETVSVDVAHVLNQSTSADFTNTLSSAINAAASSVSGVSFDGTTLSFSSGTTNSSSAKYAGTANQSFSGDANWSGIASAAGSTTGTYAQVALDSHDVSDQLRLTNFGFNIPTGATITGITVSLATTATSTPRSGHSVRLTKNEVT